MTRWVQRAEEENKIRREVEQSRKKQILANQHFLREQMGGVSPTEGSALSGKGGFGHSDIKTKKKYALGGMMNPEEAKMNRALLHEIAKVKRGEASQDILNMAKNPI